MLAHITLDEPIESETEVLCDVCGDPCTTMEGASDLDGIPFLLVQWGCSDCPDSVCSPEHYEEHMNRVHDTDVVWSEAG